jgi:hypothetical protein
MRSHVRLNPILRLLESMSKRQKIDRTVSCPGRLRRPSVGKAFLLLLLT